MAGDDAHPMDTLVGRPASQALPALVERHGRKVLLLGLKFCGNREDAEDLVQETFLQAFRKWDRFEGRSSPTSWLYAIAARGCQRMRRRRSGEPRHVESLDAELPSGTALAAELRSSAGDPFDDELRRRAAEVVDRALGRLPADYRLPLILKEIGELSLREIGEILGVKEATVKTRVHRGRLALRAELAESLGAARPRTGDHPHQVCLDLLGAKLDAMDRGVPFPVPDEELCARCKAFVDSLDLTAEACRWVEGGELSPRLRRRLETALDRAAVAPPG
ncbi:MAG: sigma-70 family RNA polymerase sigma factor [Acidobacteriota bacterium]|nr:sigma-70 family RNA polymerase sigma factor [Acidobacteriota bacterium]MDH3525541.1 sigma-70 family RNA polymerase sigma factor [Acidobacteriota bacterium]